MSPTLLDSSLVVRRANPEDSLALHWLARLARRPTLAGPALLAERDGVPVAVISLTSGAVTADPWSSSEHTVGALKFGRYRVMCQNGYRGGLRSLRQRVQATHPTSPSRIAPATVWA